MSEALPIEGIREAFVQRHAEGPVVVSAPTGSGKSTRVPVWALRGGRVLVVEPRRVACRALAQRVAEVEGERLGGRIGYRVRNESRASADTELLFATPGIVLRMLGDDRDGEGIEAFGTVILDEFHERRLDVDLLLALLLRRSGQRLVVMSATLEADRVAEHVGGVHVRGEGRQFPVDAHFHPWGTTLPDAKDLDRRVVRAVNEARKQDGDVLVFLPGKGEIAGAAQALSGQRDLEVLELHGGLGLEAQSRAFRSSDRRKVILATNVAETSVTVPGIGVVVDSGLVRRTRYHRGRGYLTLSPVAWDSAEQRAGRAGRTGPGVCLRLWSEQAQLQDRTPPEVHRESLVPLLLAAESCGERVEELPFLDEPPEYALDAARGELTDLGALDDAGRLTERGRRIFGLPLDPHHGRLLVEAERTGCLADAIDLVAVLTTGRRLFRDDVRFDEDDERDLRRLRCDALACITAVRRGDPKRHGLHAAALKEARATAGRLRRAWSLPAEPDPDAEVDRERMARTALAADPRCAHVARPRGKQVGWANGNGEIELAAESAVRDRGEARARAIAVLDTKALGQGGRSTRILATHAMPVPLEWLVEEGFGRDRVAEVELDGDVVKARIERVFARRTIGSREEVPQGRHAREAIRDLVVRGTLFSEVLEETRERLEAAALHAKLSGEEEPPALEDWMLQRLEELGVESGEDLALLDPADLRAPRLPYHVRSYLDRDYPRTFTLPDATYRLRYDVRKREVTLERTAGSRKAEPPLNWLPRLRGFRIRLQHGNAVTVLRDRR